MNQSEFATLHGVSRKTVTKWKERGWLVFEGNSLDVDASNALIAKYRRDGSDVVGNPVNGRSQEWAARDAPECIVERVGVVVGHGSNCRVSTISWHSNGMESLMVAVQTGDRLQSVALIHNRRIQ